MKVLFFYLETISIFKSLCGKELLNRILSITTNKKCIDLIINDFQPEKRNHKKIENIENEKNEKNIEERMNKKRKIYKLKHFKYNKRNYIYCIYDDIIIKPECDGKNCKFHIDKELPDCLSLNTETGEINGFCTFITPKTKYTITCEDEDKILYSSIFITINENIIFDYNHSNGCSLVNNNTKMICDDDECLCYFNTKIKDGIHHFKLLLTKVCNNEEFKIGFNNETTYDNEDLWNIPGCYYILPVFSKSKDYTQDIDKETIEITINTITEEFIFNKYNIDNNMGFVYFGLDYPYIYISGKNNSIEILKYWID